MMTIVQTDAEIGEIVMRAFIWRRVGLVTAGIGDVALVGSAHSADTLRLREFSCATATHTRTSISSTTPKPSN